MVGLLDNKIEAEIVANKNQSIKWLLVAYWLYYINDISIMSDYMFDNLCRLVLTEWNNIESMHKSIIDKDDLIAGSLYMLKDHEYPGIIVSIACEHANIPPPPVIERNQYDLKGNLIRKIDHDE